MRKIASLLSVLMLLCTLAFSQTTRTVTGQIKDEKGDPVPFATVTETGTKNATTADANGSFAIKIKGLQLTISGTGYQPKTVDASSNTLSVALSTVTSQLAEVVVTTALGVKRSAKELGYATTTVGNKLLTQGKSVNVQQALNGKVSGLNISTINSGVFETAKINIRGIRSLTGNNQPMLIVDGAPTPLGFLSSIPPDDVQEVTVLKSSASAAIYGPDAVNGVIVVVTKRGTSGRLNVTVSSSVEATRVAFFPKLQNRFGDGAGETFDQYGNYLYVPYENQQYGPAFDGSIKDIGVQLEDGSIQSGPYSNLHFKDKKNFWNTGLTLQNSVSLAGEDFYLSVNDAKIKGVMPDDENRRTSFRFNAGKKYGKLSVNYGLNYTLQNFNVVNEAGLAGLLPAYNGSIFFLVMQSPSNVPLLSYKDWKNDKFSQYSNYYNEFAVNPYWIIGNIRTKGRSDDLIGNIDINFQVAPWLKATARLNTDFNFGNFKNSTAPVIVTDWAVANRNAVQYTNRPGNVFDDQSFNSRINLDYFLSGDRKIGNSFGVSYIAGGSVRQNRSKEVGVGGNNLVVPYLFNVSARSGDANVPAGNNFDQQSRLISAFGSVKVGFKDWAWLEGTGRNDWDSRLLENKRSFFYPGASLSIILSDAIPALKSNRILSYAKLRAAVSKSGNVNLGVYATQATYSQPAGFPFGTVAGYTANNTIPSPDLKPEFVNAKEIGLELGFLKNRIYTEVTYFYQNCNNQILNISQSSTTGYTTAVANAASFKNYGVEMDLNLNPLVKIGKGRIDLKINATYNDNKVVKTFNNLPVVIGGNNQFISNSISSPTVNNIAVVGMPAFAFQLTDYERDSATGKVIVDPITGMPSEATGLVIKGRTLPTWIVGFTPSFTLGSFGLSLTWDFKTGHNFYSGIGSDADFAGISARSAEYGRQRFVFPNSVYWNGSKYVDNTSIQVQDGNAGFWTGAKTNNAIGTNYYASAAAWRLREVNISYTLPLKWTGNGRIIKRVTLSAIGKNLFLIAPKSNQWGDPEFNSAGGNTNGVASVFQTPASRLFGGSLTVQF